MKLKFNWKRDGKIAAAILVVVLFIAFTERKQGSVSLQDISVKIKNSNDNHFLEEQDVLRLMQLNSENMRGAELSSVNLRDIERRIKLDPFIHNAEIYSDLKGNLVVAVELRRPIARMVRSDGPDGYIAEDGTIMPVSDKFTARVVLISGAYVKQLLKQHNVADTEEGKQVMELIKAIREDDFWNAQIAQLEIDSKTRITLLSQIGDERIQFGKPSELETKFKKLKIYYKEILPRVGWNKYSKVSLEYEGQIVAE